MKTEIALRSKQEEIRNQLEKTKQIQNENISLNENSNSKADVNDLGRKSARASFVGNFQNVNTTSVVDSPMKMLFEKARKKSVGKGRREKNMLCTKKEYIYD